MLERLKASGIFLGSDPKLRNVSDNDIQSERVAVRGEDEVFYAVNSTIRATELSPTVHDFKTLQPGLIDFDVQKLILNQSGDLLAVVGRSKIVVCFLPPPGFIGSTGGTTFRARQLAVDSANNPPVLKVLWSPLSRYNSNLVVLRADATIKSYDVSESAAVPYSVYAVNSALRSKRRGFSVNAFDTDPVSISYGSQQNPKGALTLYIMDRSGDLHFLYPFLPNYLSITEDFIELLLNESTVLANKANEESIQAYLEQVRFVSALWKGKERAEKEVVISSSNKVKRYIFKVGSKNAELKLQGPLLVRPFPEELYDKDGVDIISIKGESQDSDFLACSYSDGSILVLVQLENHIMRWNNLDYDYSSGLTLVEHLKTPSSKSGKSVVKHLHKTTIPYVFAASSLDGSVVCVDIRDWAAQIENAIFSGDGNLFSQSNSSTVTVSVKSGKLEGISDVAIEGHTGNVRLLVVTPSLVEFLEFNDRDDGSEDSTGVEAEIPSRKIQGLRSAWNATEVSHQLDGIQNEIRKLRVSAGKFDLSDRISADDKPMMALSFISGEITKLVVKLNLIALLCHGRIQSQRQKFQQQILSVAEKKDSFSGLDDSVSENVKKIETRQRAIDQRLEKVAQKIQSLKLGNSPLSEEEAAFYKELNRVKKVVADSSTGLARRSVLLKEQVEELRVAVEKSLMASNIKDGHNWKKLVDSLRERQQFSEHLCEFFKETMKLEEKGVW